MLVLLCRCNKKVPVHNSGTYYFFFCIASNIQLALHLRTFTDSCRRRLEMNKDLTHNNDLYYYPLKKVVFQHLV